MPNLLMLDGCISVNIQEIRHDPMSLAVVIVKVEILKFISFEGLVWFLNNWFSGTV